MRKLGFHGAAILLVVMLAPAGVSLAGAQSIAAGACGTWVPQTSPDTGTGDNNLNGIAAITPSNVWAVGYYFVGVNTVTLIEHWDGTSWSVVKSPNVGTGDLLNGVYAVSATDIWAVGGYSNGTAGRTLIEHWDGTSWSVVPSPNAGKLSNELFAIRGTSANSIWAVGNALVSYPEFHTLVLHWDGTKWRAVPSPSVGTGTNDLNAVRPQSLTDAWAVGRYNNGTVNKTLVLHWDGTKWRVVPSPNVGKGDNVLRGVRAFSPTDAWAVGDYYNGTVDKTLILHWGGSHWRVWPSPNVGNQNNDLNAIGGTSPTDAYAVGETFGTASTALVLHWGGSHWRLMPGPNVGTTGNDLNAVFALSPTNVWAAGAYINGGPDQTLVGYCG